MPFDIAPSSHLFNACELRPEKSTRDNYAADLQLSLRGELSTLDSTRQFFQSMYPTSGMKDICRGIFKAKYKEQLANTLGSGRTGAERGERDDKPQSARQAYQK
ncbi:MAG: hypothetical protein OXK79_07565 [Chloroflexota bacterium]|nr:hypothetical protein [Chloroflexota bacterium]